MLLLACARGSKHVQQAMGWDAWNDPADTAWLLALKKGRRQVGMVAVAPAEHADHFMAARGVQTGNLHVGARSVHKLNDSHLCCVAPPELNLSCDPGEPALPLGEPLRRTFKQIGHQVLIIDVCLRLQWDLYWVSSNVVCWSWQIQSSPCKLGGMLIAAAAKAF